MLDRVVILLILYLIVENFLYASTNTGVHDKNNIFLMF